MESKENLMNNPVITVVIMVTITVVLATSLYVFALGNMCVPGKDNPKGDIQIVVAQKISIRI